MSKEFIPENELEGTNYHLTWPWFDPGWPQKFRGKNLRLKFWFVAVLSRYDRYLRRISVNEFLIGFIFDLTWPWFGPEWPQNWTLTQNREMVLKKLCWEIVLMTISQFLKFLKLWFLVLTFKNLLYFHNHNFTTLFSPVHHWFHQWVHQSRARSKTRNRRRHGYQGCYSHIYK